MPYPSHAAARTSDSPTPAQLKELFAQIENGRVTKDSLQQFLRGGERRVKKRAEERMMVCDLQGSRCNICGGAFADGDDICSFRGHEIGQAYPVSNPAGYLG